MKRPSPALVVALLALLVAMGGTSYAAVTLSKNSVGSAQIKNNSVKGKDIKDGTITSKDIKPGTLPSGVTGACATGQLRVGTVCLIKATRAVVPLTTAIQDCANLGGRLPTYDELVALSKLNPAANGVTWVDNMPMQYEYSGTIAADMGELSSVASDEAGNLLPYESNVPLGHHCVIP